MIYHGLAVRINSVNDATILRKNFVKFGPELTEIICEVRHGKNLAYFIEYLWIYWTDFLQSFHHMKALYVQITDLYLIFQFVKGCCHGNQIMLP